MEDAKPSEFEVQPSAPIDEQQASALHPQDEPPNQEGNATNDAGLLKSYKNAREDQDIPRALITAKDLPLPEEPLKPACRVVLDFSFQQLSSWRFESAEIELEFEDAANVRLHGAKISEDAIVDTTHQPRVLAFEPQYFSGPVSFAEVTTDPNLQVTVSPLGGIIGLSGGSSATKPYQLKDSFKMHGVVRDNPPSPIVWTVTENKLTREGIRREFSTALIISYTPGHKFAARVRVRANLWMGFLRPVCGKKDEPIFFNPEKMSLKGQVRSEGESTGTEQQMEGARTVFGVEDEVFDRESLKALTRLSLLGGEFL